MQNLGLRRDIELDWHFVKYFFSSKPIFCIYSDDRPWYHLPAL